MAFIIQIVYQRHLYPNLGVFGKTFIHFMFLWKEPKACCPQLFGLPCCRDLSVLIPATQWAESRRQNICSCAQLLVVSACLAMSRNPRVRSNRQHTCSRSFCSAGPAVTHLNSECRWQRGIPLGKQITDVQEFFYSRKCNAFVCLFYWNYSCPPGLVSSQAVGDRVEHKFAESACLGA